MTSLTLSMYTPCSGMGLLTTWICVLVSVPLTGRASPLTATRTVLTTV